MREFLPEGANYILFGFDLSCSSNDEEVLKRLEEVCDSFVVILRFEPKIEREKGKEPAYYNFDNSVSRLIQWLRDLE